MGASNENSFDGYVNTLNCLNQFINLVKVDFIISRLYRL